MDIDYLNLPYLLVYVVLSQQGVRMKGWSAVAGGAYLCPGWQLEVLEVYHLLPRVFHT